MSQPLAALAVANEIRLGRSEHRRHLKSLPRVEARRELAALVADPPSLWRTATLGYVLGMPARTGPATVRRWLFTADLSATKRLGEMTPRQRRVLAGVIR